MDEGPFPQDVHFIFVAHPEDARDNGVGRRCGEGLEKPKIGGESRGMFMADKILITQSKAEL